jgi:endonuclease/exonuclease/phosphatase family metal-dependent hydrolase
MQVLTWNIQWGLGIDGRVDLTRIASEIRRVADPDVICLQEVTDGFDDLKGNDGSDQFAALAAAFPNYVAINAPALDFGGKSGRRRRFGNMILSRLAVGSVERRPLPRLTQSDHECMPRGVVTATVATPIGAIRIMTTHLEWSAPQLRTPQIEELREAHREICSRIANPPRPGKAGYAPQVESSSTILVGDFNMTPDEPNRQLLMASFQSTSVPRFVDAFEAIRPNEQHPYSMCLFDDSDGLARCLDYVFCTEDLATSIVRVHYDQTSPASDHQPVVVELNGESRT